jgi:gliding motility-associated-like protein
MHAINECGFANASKTIQVKAYPTAHAGNDTTVCISQPVTLTTPTGTGYSYSWTNGTTTVSTTHTATVTPSTNTTYTLTVTGPGGCKRKDTVTVLVQTPSTASYIDSVCPGGANNIILMADTSGTYSWSTGATTQQISVNDTGTYTVTVNIPGAICARQLTYDVKPDPCPVEIILTLPNVFSPNGDGVNDFYTPITSGDFDKFNIKIYNRWGQLIYESTDPFFKWNGQNKQGKTVPDGTYYFIAESTLHGVDNKPMTGFITLTR